MCHRNAQAIAADAAEAVLDRVRCDAWLRHSKTYVPGAGAIGGWLALPRVAGAVFWPIPRARSHSVQRPPRTLVLGRAAAPCLAIGRRLRIQVVAALRRAGRIDQALNVPGGAQHSSRQQLRGAVARLPRRNVIRRTAGDEHRTVDLLQIDRHVADLQHSGTAERVVLEDVEKSLCSRAGNRVVSLFQ